MYDPVQKRVYISNDVIVDETKEWNWTDFGKRVTTETVEIELESGEEQCIVHTDTEHVAENE